jgi:hypothetical protein
MIDIPPFKTPTDEDLYLDMFDDKLTAYLALMDKVKDAIYGPGFGNYSNLPGSCFQVLEKITSDLVNVTSHEYVLVQKNSLKNYSLGEK